MNNNLSVTMTTVNIGDKVLTIMSDTVDPVMEAGAAWRNILTLGKTSMIYLSIDRLSS